MVIRERLFPALLVLLISLAFVGWLGASEAAADTDTASVNVKDWTELSKAIEDGTENIVLISNITPGMYEARALTVKADTEVNLDLNGWRIDFGLVGKDPREGGYFADVEGTLTIKDTGGGGEITGCCSTGPGCIKVKAGGKFILESGMLAGNAGAWGGGVHNKDGEFIMKGGAIAGNQVKSGSYGYGGGVHNESGTMIMTGGEISNNDAGKIGGGINNDATLIISGGTITQNVCGTDDTTYGGGGIRNDGTLTISGNPVIKDNRRHSTAEDTEENNIHQSKSSLPPINIDGPLSEDSEIGITLTSSAGDSMIFTSGLKGNGTPAAFFSDNEAYVIAAEDNGKGGSEAAVSKKDDCFTATFNAEGYEPPKPYYVVKENRAVEPVVDWEGVYEVTWIKDGAEDKYDFTEQVKENLVLNAKVRPGVTLTLDPGEGSGTAYELTGPTDGIMLPDPTKDEDPSKVFSRDGYTFTEWDCGGDKYQAGQTYPFEQPVTLIACWSPIDYRIKYELDGGALPEGAYNPISYNIETETFTLVNPAKEDYHFYGWTWEGQTVPVKEVTIDKGSTGDLSFTAAYGEHLWYGGTVVKKATVSADGEMMYKCTGCDATKTEAIPKQVLTAKAGKKVYTLKAKKLRKKAQTVKTPVKVTNSAQTKVTYKLAGVKKAKFKKKFKVNAKNGTITVKKGVKKGTYTVSVKVTTAADDMYEAAAKTVAVKVKVK